MERERRKRSSGHLFFQASSLFGLIFTFLSFACERSELSQTRDVIGKDQRIPLPRDLLLKTEGANRIGLLEFHGSKTHCSAYVVESEWILTAAHCVFETEGSILRKNLVRSYRELRFKLAYASGLAQAESEIDRILVSAQGWQDFQVGRSFRTHDFALLHLAEPVGTFDILPIATDFPQVKGGTGAKGETDALELMLPAYAADLLAENDLPAISQSCEAKPASHRNSFFHTCDTDGGASGAPLFLRSRMDKKNGKKAGDGEVTLQLAGLHLAGLSAKRASFVRPSLSAKKPKSKAPPKATDSATAALSKLIRKTPSGEVEPSKELERREYNTAIRARAFWPAVEEFLATGQSPALHELPLTSVHYCNESPLDLLLVHTKPVYDALTVGFEKSLLEPGQCVALRSVPSRLDRHSFAAFSLDQALMLETQSAPIERCVLEEEDEISAETELRVARAMFGTCQNPWMLLNFEALALKARVFGATMRLAGSPVPTAVESTLVHSTAAESRTYSFHLTKGRLIWRLRVD